MLFKDTGFTNLDIREAKKVIIERFGEFPFFEVGKIVEKTNLKQFHLKLSPHYFVVIYLP